jgi:hypothetical protein
MFEDNRIKKQRNQHKAMQFTETNGITWNISCQQQHITSKQVLTFVYVVYEEV